MEKKPFILLVEDQLPARIAAKGLLEHLGCEVKTAETGKNAIQLFQENQFDLIFMDIGLPDTDGFTVAATILEIPNHPKPPIIALTAHDDKETEEKAIKAGMQYFLTKPLKESDVKSLFEKLIIHKN